jgi:molecular chaperone GrpE
VNTADVSVNEQETREEEILSSDEIIKDAQISEADVIAKVEEVAVDAVAEEVAEEQIAVEEAEKAEEDELSRLMKQLQAKEQEAKEHYDARLRLQAELENFRKRKEKEIFEFRKYANESLIQDILPIVDDFERAIAAAEQTHKLEDFLAGIELIFSKFLDALQKKGVKEIEAAEGQPFNPEMHEAVTQIETDEVEEGSIAKIFQKGYALHDRILRAPKVGVAKKRQ